MRPSSRAWVSQWRGTSGTGEGSASPGAVLAAGSVDGFWPGVRFVSCLPVGPWEGKEEGYIPRDFFLGYCRDFFLGREPCSLWMLGLRVDSFLPLPPGY